MSASMKDKSEADYSARKKVAEEWLNGLKAARAAAPAAGGAPAAPGSGS